MAPKITIVENYRAHKEYTIDFFGDELIVTETETPSVIRRWIRSAIYKRRRSRPLVAGVGVNWTPAYNRRSVSSPPPDPEADTLQLCVGKRCLIIHLSRCVRVPRILRRFLADTRNTFVGIWNAQDARKLKRSRHELEVGELLDVKEYVTDSKGRSLSRCSFEVIVEKCLGFRGVKLVQEISTSDWSVRFLDFDQILQATVDAYVCFALGVSFRLWDV